MKQVMMTGKNGNTQRLGARDNLTGIWIMPEAILFLDIS